MIQLPVTLKWNSEYTEAKCSDGTVYEITIKPGVAFAFKVHKDGEYWEGFSTAGDARRMVEWDVMQSQVRMEAPCKYPKGTAVYGVVTEDSNGPEAKINVTATQLVPPVFDRARDAGTFARF